MTLVPGLIVWGFLAGWGPMSLSLFGPFETQQACQQGKADRVKAVQIHHSPYYLQTYNILRCRQYKITEDLRPILIKES